MTESNGPLPVLEARLDEPTLADRRRADGPLARSHFCAMRSVERRGIARAVLGLSGGVDSALVAYLCARALGPKNVYAIRLPYASSAASSLSDAQRVIDALGINAETSRSPTPSTAT